MPLLTRAVSTAANESGAAQSVGRGSGIGGIGAGAPAISAGMGQATFVGVLSVPTAWAGAAPSASPPVAMQFAGTPPYRLRRLVRTRAYRR
jgi:PPE-repeat protein